MATDRGHPRAKKSLGQNFLVDGNLQRKVARAVRPASGDEILEIGPGTGALTRHLVGIPKRLVLVELDDRLSDALRAEYASEPGVLVIHADFLKLDLEDVVEDVSALKVVGNIPYNVTAPIVFKLLRRPRPAEIVLMVQREVARRMTAAAGTREYGALSVGIQSVAAAELLFDVPSTAFRPVPRVESAVVRITPDRPPGATEAEEARLRSLTRAAFGQRRKQLQKILRTHAEYGLRSASVERLQRASGLDLSRRPETFSPDELASLASLIEVVRGAETDER